MTIAVPTLISNCLGGTSDRKQPLPGNENTFIGSAILNRRSVVQEEIVSFLQIKCLKRERKQKEEKRRKEGMFSSSYKPIYVVQNEVFYT